MDRPNYLVGITLTYNDGVKSQTCVNRTGKSDDDIRSYFLGKVFNFGDNDFGDPDLLRRCIRVDIHS